MPENATANDPFARLLDEMAETAKLWMSAAPGQEYSEALRDAARRTAELSAAWAEPLRRLREDHLHFAEEMATWAERHRQFAEQVSQWADAHRNAAQRLRQWTEPIEQYADLLNESMRAVVTGMEPPDPDGGAARDRSD